MISNCREYLKMELTQQTLENDLKLRVKKIYKHQLLKLEINIGIKHLICQNMKFKHAIGQFEKFKYVIGQFEKRLKIYFQINQSNAWTGYS